MKYSYEDLKSKLFLKYGLEITIRDKEDYYDSNKNYVFIRKSPYIHRKDYKEFTMKPQDILNRNYYWIDSLYRQNAVYDRLIPLKGYEENKKIELSIPIKKAEGDFYYFTPRYYNSIEKKFIHYFDKSFYRDIEDPNNLLLDIIEYFENEKEYTLEMYEFSYCSRDYD
jgi:hypothetical protein